MPDLKKAELIEGVVYMGSPVSHQHAEPHLVLGYWLMSYVAGTPGLMFSDNGTLLLDLDNEPQPDLLLCIPRSAGGACRLTDQGYLEGPPELTIEVAVSSKSYDLHQKFGAYRRNGVKEYLVLRVADGEVDWFVLEAGTYVRQQPDGFGILKSRVFPGLWLDVGALLAGDLRALREGVERGLHDPAHGEFLARLDLR